MLRRLPLLMFVALWPAVALAHDPSAWGGLFRSRDHGRTWLAVSEGRFVSGALGLAISPTDVNHLLLGTDSGLLRTRNGGRDWEVEAPATLVGAVFAVAFDGDGTRALASTALGIFRGDGLDWRPSRAPSGAAPARAIVRGIAGGRVYLVGLGGFWRSDDWGVSWVDAGGGLPEGSVTTLVVRPGAPETLYAVVGGRLWTSADGARSWGPRGDGLPEGNLETVAPDAREPGRLWAAGGDRVYRSDDRGATWEARGNPLSEAGTTVHNIAAAPSGREIVVTTHRGLYRSPDGGRTWELMLDNLPAHLEAGPLVRDPVDPVTLYAGFSLTPYGDLLRMAAAGETLLDRLDALSLAGAAAFLIALGLGAFWSVRWLNRRYRAPARTSAEPAGARGPVP